MFPDPAEGPGGIKWATSSRDAVHFHIVGKLTQYPFQFLSTVGVTGWSGAALLLLLTDSQQAAVRTVIHDV